MDEAARKQRNIDRLSECYPAFATKVRGIIDALEAQGLRPRIQDAYRSPEEQLVAFNTGHSKLKFGFHNVTGANGAKEALACDLLDDDHPTASATHYLLALAAAARGQGLQTGILWGLPPAVANGVEAALASGNFDANVKVGWDPTHVEPTGMSPADAKAGKRPNGPPATGSAGAASEYVVKAGDNLGKIAKAHGTTVARLLELNPELRPNPNLIRVGQHVRLG